MDFKTWFERVKEIWDDQVMRVFQERPDDYKAEEDADGYRRDADELIRTAEWGDWLFHFDEGHSPHTAILLILDDNGNQRDADILRAEWKQ